MAARGPIIRQLTEAIASISEDAIFTAVLTAASDADFQRAACRRTLVSARYDSAAAVKENLRLDPGTERAAGIIARDCPEPRMKTGAL